MLILLFSLTRLWFLSSTTTRVTVIGMTGTIISKSSGRVRQRLTTPASAVSARTASKRFTNATPTLWLQLSLSMKVNIFFMYNLEGIELVDEGK